MDKFKNKQGLTQYAFACGYVQREKIEHKGYHNRVDLFLDGGVYQVMVSHTIEDNKGRLVSSEMVEWLCFDHLTSARKEHKKQIKLYKNKAA